MRKLLILMLFFPGISHAGTITTYMTPPGQITFASPSTARTFTYIQSKGCGATVASEPCAYTSNIGGGDFLVAFCEVSTTTTGMTVSDNVNGSWTKVLASDVPEANGIGAGHFTNVWYLANAIGGATTVTCARSLAAAAQLEIHEYSVSAPNPVFDVASSSSPAVSGPNPVSGNITTSLPNEFVFAGAKPNGSVTGQSGTLRVNDSLVFFHATEDTVVSTPGTYQSTFTQGTSNHWMMIQAAFK